MPRPFPLTSLLRLREQKETAEERALAVANAASRTAALQLRDLQQKMEEHAESRRHDIGQAYSAAHYQAIATQWKAWQSQRDAQHQTLLHLESLRRGQQERLLFARQQREMMQELHSSFTQTQRETLDKQEQRRLDDLSASRSRNTNRARFAESN